MVGGIVLVAIGLLSKEHVSSALAPIFPESRYLLPLLAVSAMFALGYSALIAIGFRGGRMLERKVSRR